MLRHASKLLACCLALSACVTINVYFPAAAAEKAADEFIKGVVGEKSTEPATKRDDDKQGAVREAGGAHRVLLAAAASVLDFVVSPAHAQQANLNIDTPATRQLQDSMKQRHASLQKYYDAGSIGMTRDGLVQVRDQNLVPLPDRNAVRKLIAEENADRNNLYREIAVANGHPEWEADIRSTFAERWAARADSSGWYYQDASGAWKKK